MDQHRWAILAIGLIGVLLVAPSGVMAQVNGEVTPLPDPIVTDRPTDSASPLLVPRRSLQLEAGYKVSFVDDDEDRIYTREVPDVLIRYGLSRNVEVRLASAGWTVESDAADKEAGFSDISLGAKVFLADERGARPQMGLLVDVNLPVGHSDHTSGRIAPRVLFLGSNTLSGRLTLTYNFGPGIIAVEADGDSRSSVNL